MERRNSGVSALVIFDLKIFRISDYLASWWGRMGVWEISSHAVHNVTSHGLKVDVVGGSPPLTFH